MKLAERLFVYNALLVTWYYAGLPLSVFCLLGLVAIAGVWAERAIYGD